jgi:UDP-GlcNAc:undecaprenyl-phosphate GlcNAc-1-phosphate transferase
MIDREAWACLIIFGAGAVATFAVTFGVRNLAIRLRLVVMPDPERVHTVPTPTTGGVGMFLGFLVALGLARELAPLRGMFVGSYEPLGVLGALAIMLVVGLIDDVRDVSAPAKVAGQVLAAMVLYALGVTMYHFKVPFAGYIVLSPSVLPLVTALWVVGIANAVNLIDGLDGLAAGVVAIAAGALCAYGLRLEALGVLPANNIGPFVAAATCGLCVGFLPHNFHRARIFMGDTGAMVLGLLMAASTMAIGGQAYLTYSGQTYFFFAPLLVPFFILGVPLLDTAFAIIRRTARRSGVAVRDLEHLHHRLMRLGHGHRRSVLVLWTWTGLLSALVLYPAFYPRWNAAIPIGIGVLAAGLYTLFQPGRRRDATLANGRAPVAAPGAEIGPGAAVAAGLAGASAGGREDPGGPVPVTALETGGTPTGAGEPPEAGDAAEATHGETHRGQHRRRFARHDPPMRG